MQDDDDDWSELSCLINQSGVVRFVVQCMLVNLHTEICLCVARFGNAFVAYNKLLVYAMSLDRQPL